MVVYCPEIFLKLLSNFVPKLFSVVTGQYFKKVKFVNRTKTECCSVVDFERRP